MPEAYFLRNLKACIQYAQQQHADIFLLGLMPQFSSMDGKLNQYGKRRFSADIDKYNDLLEILAVEERCYYLDVNPLFEKYDMVNLLHKDGLHPNSDGHQMIYQLVKESLINNILELNH